MSPTPPRRPAPPDRRGASPARSAPTASSSASDSSAGPPPAGGLDPLVGREIAGHKILQRVATGRLCSTYRANHTAMNRLVAFKALTADADQNTIAKFHETAKHAAQLHHPNIASIYDVNTDAGVHFCAMEFVEGQTIGELLRAKQRIPSADAIRVAIDVAEALRFANTKGVPGWRLSANRVIITKRGEVKILPPSFSPPGAPVLDDRYVTAAVGVLLYAMLSGGKVHDIEWALEPGSSAPKQLDRLRNSAPGIRRDVAQVVERLLGLAGEPFPNVDAALHGLRALLAAKEQLEARTRGASDSARARVQRTRTGLYIAIGAITLAVLIVLGVVIGQGCVSSGAEKRFTEASRVAEAAYNAFKDAQARFHAAPSDALAKEVLSHLERARAAFGSVASAFPDHPKGQTAAQNARSIEEEVRKFQEVAAATIRFSVARARIQEVDKELARECADRRERGGEVDVAAWRKRYLALDKELADSDLARQSIRSIVANLPRRILEEQIKIDANAASNDVRRNCIPSLQFGKAIEVWNEYRRKYARLESEALRKQVLDRYDAAATEIRQAANLKFMALDQQAKFDIGKQKYDKARAIYSQIVENFGLPKHVEPAKEALAKIPK